VLGKLQSSILLCSSFAKWRSWRVVLKR